jgi:Zn-dependent M32 family carboxypeptidase
MSADSVARVLGHALVDKTFAEQLQKDPVSAAHSIGVHLGQHEASAIKEIQLHQLDSVANTIRSKLGKAAVLDQQQQQARMD